MNPQTEQLFSTLELLCCNPFVWEKSTEDELSLWNLIYGRFVKPTDLKLAFAHWQNIEEWGTPTNQAENDYEYAPTRSEREDDNWNENIAKERKSYYQQLFQFVTNNLTNLQAYNLSASPKNENLQWEHPDFSISIVVGQVADNYWLCFAPTVPNQVSYYSRKEKNAVQEEAIIHSVESASEIISIIQSILAKIPPILIYGYYDGGYNFTYQHRIVAAKAPTKESAIALALQSAEMVVIEKTTVKYPDEHNLQLNQFMNKCLHNRTIYDLSFWDIGYTYDLGQTPTGDWIGALYENEFEYNP